MAKLSISIDDAELRWVKQRARRLHGGNLSAAIAEGMRLLRHNEALGKLLDELGAPELSAADVDSVAAELTGEPRRRRAKRSAV